MRFSVIIPTYNRPRDLARCLAALTRLDYSKDEFEVIVVDDGGGADLEPLIAQCHSALNLKIQRQKNSGPATARNTGAAHASGQFLAFIDDDCEPQEQWLRVLDGAIAGAPDVLIGGCVLNGLPESVYATASQDIADFLHQHFNRDSEHGRFFPSNNIALSADLYRQMGGFDSAFRRNAAEDRDFCDRWLRHGRRLVTVSEAVILHFREMSFRDFWKQHFRYGCGAFTYATARRLRNAGPVPFEGIRIHLSLIASPLRKSLRPRSFYLSFLILVSQIAVVAGYFVEMRAQKGRSKPLPDAAKARSIRDSASLPR